MPRAAARLASRGPKTVPVPPEPHVAFEEPAGFVDAFHVGIAGDAGDMGDDLGRLQPPGGGDGALDFGEHSIRWTNLFIRDTLTIIGSGRSKMDRAAFHTQVRAALAHSGALIVIASPAARASRWVDQEIALSVECVRMARRGVQPVNQITQSLLFTRYNCAIL